MKRRYKETRIWGEIRNDFVDELGVTYIDAWETEDDNEEGKVIALVNPDGTVEYKDERAKDDEYTQEIINEVLLSMGCKDAIINAIDEVIGYLEDRYNNLTSGGMSDSEGICNDVARYIYLLEMIKESYEKKEE